MLAHGDIHESHAGFVTGDSYEREADMFAASLLMPDALFTHEMRALADGLQAVETLATRCVTSLPAAANRYVQKASVPVAMLVSTGPRIDYCFMSGALQDFDGLEWPRKGQQLPAGTETDRFNADADKVRLGHRAFGAHCPLVAEFVEKVGSGPDVWCSLLVRADLLAPSQGPAEAVLRCLSMGLKVGGIDQAVTG